MTHPHDALAKYTFAQPRLLAGELRSVLPPRVVGTLNFDDLEILPGSFVDIGLRMSHTDILAKVPTRDRADVFIYVIFEHQSTADGTMPWRMYQYLGRIWKYLITTGSATARNLPIVVPVVLHHGERPWTTARTLHEIIGDLAARPELARYLPNFSLLINDLVGLNDDDLLARPLEPVTRLTLVALRDARHPTRAVPVLVRWLGRYHATLSDEDGALFARYLMEVLNARSYEEFSEQLKSVYPDMEEEMTTYAEEAVRFFREEFRAKGLEEGRAQGLEEGREQGHEEGRRDALRSTLTTLMTARFETLEPRHTERIESADAAELAVWVARVIPADGPDDVFDQPGGS